MTDDARLCPKCGKEYTYHVEYSYDSPERYDGISEHVCERCRIRVGRWTGKVLKDGEVEPRFGEGEPFVPVPCQCGNLRNPKYATCFDCFSKGHGE